MMIMEKLFVLAQGSAEALLWLLFLLSVLSVGCILERFFTLRSVYKKNQVFRKKAQDLLQSHVLEDVPHLVGDRTSLSGIALSHGLRHMKSAGPQGLMEIFNSYQLIEKPLLEKNLNFLATVGSNAPFIGLLGTVLGIMKAFSDLAGNSQGGNQVVMEGIAHALVATAVGLFVAIPAVIAYNYFQKLVQQILQSIDTARELCLAYSKTQKAP